MLLAQLKAIENRLDMMVNPQRTIKLIQISCEGTKFKVSIQNTSFVTRWFDEKDRLEDFLNFTWGMMKPVQVCTERNLFDFVMLFLREMPVFPHERIVWFHIVNFNYLFENYEYFLQKTPTFLQILFPRIHRVIPFHQTNWKPGNPRHDMFECGGEFRAYWIQSTDTSVSLYIGPIHYKPIFRDAFQLTLEDHKRAKQEHRYILDRRLRKTQYVEFMLSFRKVQTIQIEATRVSLSSKSFDSSWGFDKSSLSEFLHVIWTMMNMQCNEDHLFEFAKVLFSQPIRPRLSIEFLSGVDVLFPDGMLTNMTLFAKKLFPRMGAVGSSMSVSYAEHIYPDGTLIQKARFDRYKVFWRVQRGSASLFAHSSRIYHLKFHPMQHQDTKILLLQHDGLFGPWKEHTETHLIWAENKMINPPVNDNFISQLSTILPFFLPKAPQSYITKVLYEICRMCDTKLEVYQNYTIDAEFLRVDRQMCSQLVRICLSPAGYTAEEEQARDTGTLCKYKAILQFFKIGNERHLVNQNSTLPLPSTIIERETFFEFALANTKLEIKRFVPDDQLSGTDTEEEWIYEDSD